MARKAKRRSKARRATGSGTSPPPSRRTAAPPPPQKTSGSAPLIAGSILALVAVVAVVALLLAGGDSEEQQPTTSIDTAAVSAGQSLFRSNCAQCHGVDLQGTSSGPPFLIATYAPNHHGDEAFQSAVANGVTPHHWNFGPMPPIDGLSRDEVAQIVAYVRSEQVRAGILSDPSHP